MHARMRSEFNNVQKLSDKCKCKLVECSVNSACYMQYAVMFETKCSNRVLTRAVNQT